jgi:hypothetical protein
MTTKTQLQKSLQEILHSESESKQNHERLGNTKAQEWSPTSLVRRAYGQLSICDISSSDFSGIRVGRVTQFVERKNG